MKWWLRDKLINEIRDYIRAEVAINPAADDPFKYRFNQGLAEILERYYDTGREN